MITLKLEPIIVLHVDDDRDVRFEVEELLSLEPGPQGRPYEVIGADGLPSALDYLARAAMGEGAGPRCPIDGL